MTLQFIKTKQMNVKRSQAVLCKQHSNGLTSYSQTGDVHQQTAMTKKLKSQFGMKLGTAGGETAMEDLKQACTHYQSPGPSLDPAQLVQGYRARLAARAVIDHLRLQSTACVRLRTGGDTTQNP